MLQNINVFQHNFPPIHHHISYLYDQIEACLKGGDSALELDSCGFVVVPRGTEFFMFSTSAPCEWCVRDYYYCCSIKNIILFIIIIMLYHYCCYHFYSAFLFIILVSFLYYYFYFSLMGCYYLYFCCF